MFAIVVVVVVFERVVVVEDVVVVVTFESVVVVDVSSRSEAQILVHFPSANTQQSPLFAQQSKSLSGVHLKDVARGQNPSAMVLQGLKFLRVVVDVVVISSSAGMLTCACSPASWITFSAS